MDINTELLGIMDTIQETGAAGTQNPQDASDYIMILTAMVARSGTLQAQAKKKLHEKRAGAFLTATGSLKANDMVVPVAVLRDYINDRCAAENETFELAERTNKAATHTLEAMRSVLSALKEEFITAKYAT